MYLYLKGLWWESGGANGRESDCRGGWSHNRLWKGGIYKLECGWDHYRALSGCFLFTYSDYILNTAKV